MGIDHYIDLWVDGQKRLLESQRENEIKRLTMEVSRLRAALQRIADSDSEGYEGYQQIALEALTSH